MSRARVLALVLPACAAGVAVGYQWGRAAEAKTGARLERALADHDAQLRDTLAWQDGRARALTERLDGLARSLSGARPAEAVAAGRSAPPSPAPEAPTAVAPTPEENLAALAKAERTVDEAFAHKAWSETDRSAFESVLPTLAPDDRSRLKRRLIVAVNAGELKVKLEGPLF
jgi:hypothetical protein